MVILLETKTYPSDFRKNRHIVLPGDRVKVGLLALHIDPVESEFEQFKHSRPRSLQIRQLEGANQRSLLIKARDNAFTDDNSHAP